VDAHIIAIVIKNMIAEYTIVVRSIFIPSAVALMHSTILLSATG